MAGTVRHQWVMYHILFKLFTKFIDFSSDIRLVGGQSRMSGRVEVQYEGLWGTVCDNGWDQNAANVVCRQLGYRRAESASCCARFGAGSGQIFLDQVQCNGDEPSLSFCRHLGWTAHNCSHRNDAGVTCTNGRNFFRNFVYLNCDFFSFHACVLGSAFYLKLLFTCTLLINGKVMLKLLLK